MTDHDHDPNSDLIGFEFDADGARWRVMGTDVVLGGNYVEMRKIVSDSGDVSFDDRNMRVQNAGVIRRRKQIG